MAVTSKNQDAKKRKKKKKRKKRRKCALENSGNGVRIEKKVKKKVKKNLAKVLDLHGAGARRTPRSRNVIIGSCPSRRIQSVDSETMYGFTKATWTKKTALYNGPLLFCTRKNLMFLINGLIKYDTEQRA